MQWQQQQINITSVRFEHAKCIHELKCDRFECHCEMDDDAKRWARDIKCAAESVFTANVRQEFNGRPTACSISTTLTQSCAQPFVFSISFICIRRSSPDSLFNSSSRPVFFVRLIDGAFSTEKKT